MVSTVGYDVHKADETPVGVASSDPAQTVWTDSIPPTDLGVFAMGIDEFTHLRVRQRAAPPVRDAVRRRTLVEQRARPRNYHVI
jgi:hypothetical protein